MMPATQKLLIIILGVHDGQTKENKGLTDAAKLNMLRYITISTMYCVHTVMSLILKTQNNFGIFA